MNVNVVGGNAPRPPSPTAASSVQVVVRLRPLNGKEQKHGTLPVVSASTNDKTVTVIKGQGSRQAKTSYKFDNVFTAFSSQEEVFEATLQPVIRDVLLGFESTVFAYGQTGTGKTHTMEGDLSNPELHGVIPRSAAAIFQALQNPQYLEYSVSCSFLEIYNEELCDLLMDGSMKTKLGIMEGKNGPFCRGLSESNVNSADEVLALMRRAQTQRQVSETNMNKQSSRSHCIFTLKVQAKRKVGDRNVLEVSGKLHCVDLAGSECAKSADLSGDSDQATRERERMNINRSLLTLGRVVSMLKEQSQGGKKSSKSVRIPYRDSKLTRILQESLGGRCKTCLIATVSPSVTAIEESMSTLNYAQAANGIINKPITTSFMATQSSGSGGDQKGAPSSAGGGDSAVGAVEHWHEMECRLQYMQSQVEEAQQALARKHIQQQELVEKAERAEMAQAETVVQFEQAQEEKRELEDEITLHVTEKQRISDELEQTEQTLHQTTAILKATQKTEICLTKEAQALLSALGKSIENGDILHKSITKTREENVARKEATRKFSGIMLTLLEEVGVSADAMKDLEAKYEASIRDSSGSLAMSETAALESHRSSVEEICTVVQIAVAALKDQLIGANQAVDTMSTGIRGNMESFREIATQHTASTAKTCTALRDQLSSSSDELKQFEVKYTESSAQMLETLADNVMESTENLSQMALSMTDALAVAKKDRDESRKSLKALLAKWQDSSAQSVQGIDSLSTEQAAQVQTILNLLTSEALRHDVISKELLDQRVFLSEQHMSHIGSLENQSKRLAAQKGAFAESKRRGDDLCQQVMANVMSGVQNLLKNELAALSDYQQETTEVFVSSNAQIAEQNTGITKTAGEIMQHLQSSNQVLQDQGNVLRDIDQKASTIMKDTTTVLANIQKECGQHREATSVHSRQMQDTIDHAATDDIKSVEFISRTMKEKGQECGIQLATRILDGTQESVSKLAQSSKEAFAFTNEAVIDHTQRCIEESIVASSVEFGNLVESTTTRVLSDLATGHSMVEGLVEQHSARLNGLTDEVGANSNEIKSQLDTQQQAISEYHTTLTKSTEQHEKAMSEKLEICGDHASSGEKIVDGFSKNIIHVEDETDVVSPRIQLTFNDQLTSTPAQKTVLEGLCNGVKTSTDTHEEAWACDEKENAMSDGDDVHIAPSDELHKDSSFPVLREQTNEQVPVSEAREGTGGEIQKRRTNDSGRAATRQKRVRTRR